MKESLKRKIEEMDLGDQGEIFAFLLRSMPMNIIHALVMREQYERAAKISERMIHEKSSDSE